MKSRSAAHFCRRFDGREHDDRTIELFDNRAEARIRQRIAHGHFLLIVEPSGSAGPRSAVTAAEAARRARRVSSSGHHGAPPTIRARSPSLRRGQISSGPLRGQVRYCTATLPQMR